MHIGPQAVILTSDKRSSPALAVRMPEGDIWYGFLTSDTAPGRLSLRMPGGDIFSLTPPPNHTFTTISADYPQIYTWNGGQHGLPNNFGGQSVRDFNSTARNAGLTNVGVYPTYWVQSTCSPTTGTWAVQGDPALPAIPFSGTTRQCWCRLKRRSDGANGVWVFRRTDSTAADCAFICPSGCADANMDATFRSVALNTFTNP